MLTIILAAIQKFLLGLISLAALIAIIVGVISGHPPGNPPTAASASITTLEDAASAPVTPSVSDPDAGETFTFSIASQPANGSAAVVLRNSRQGVVAPGCRTWISLEISSLLTAHAPCATTTHDHPRRSRATKARMARVSGMHKEERS